MTEEQAILARQQEHGRAIREMMSHHGWKEYEKIVESLYKEAINNTIASESIDELRKNKAVMKALEMINERLELGILNADVAVEELSKERFKSNG
jgi:hypothetical protein